MDLHPDLRRPCRRPPAILAAVLAAAAMTAEAQTGPAPFPPPGLPKGAIVAFLPDPQSPDYSDAASLARWLAAQGWAICDGSGGTPDLNYRMLLGTVHPQEAGQHLGARTHDHRATGDTGPAVGREHRIRAGVGHALAVPADGHRHDIEARTTSAEHLPLSMRVIFILKVR